MTDKLYVASTRESLKYNKMVISKTKAEAYQALKKWWDDECLGHISDRTFEDAAEYYGFSSIEPIEIGVPFNV